MMDHLVTTSILPDATAEAVAAMAELRLALACWPRCAPPMITCESDGLGLVWIVYACEDCGEPHYGIIRRAPLPADEP